VTAPRELATLVDHVYEEILGRLLDQGIRPGTPLRTEALAATLGVSATPVREALVRLETTGLVQRSAHRGWSAAPPITLTDLLHVVDLRLLLEPENARRACELADDDLRHRLRELAELQARAPTGPDYAGYKQYLQADWQFHLAIAHATDNPYLEQAYTAVKGYMQRYMFFEQHVISDAAESTAEHAAVLDAFERRSPEIAAAAMRDHILRLRERLGASNLAHAGALPSGGATRRARRVS